MPGVAIDSSLPWYRSLNKSQWNTLIASNLGWLFDGYETYALVISVGVALRQLLEPSQYPQIPTYAGIVIAILAVPIVIQVYFNAGVSYWLNRRLGVAHCVAGPSALIGASNFFELAVAAAISLFGFESGAALATAARAHALDMAVNGYFAHTSPTYGGIDTRAVVRHLRSRGSMKAGVFSGAAAEAPVDELVDRVRNEPAEDPEKKVPFSTRQLVPCMREGARLFGWDKRQAAGSRRASARTQTLPSRPPAPSWCAPRR